MLFWFFSVRGRVVFLSKCELTYLSLIGANDDHIRVDNYVTARPTKGVIIIMGLKRGERGTS